MVTILIVGSGAREHVMATLLKRSPTQPAISCYASSEHPGLSKLSTHFCVGDMCEGEAIARQAHSWNVDFAIIGPEAPLQAGVVDCLLEAGIPVVGPTKALARIETSKFFARELMRESGIQGGPRYQFFDSMQGVQTFLDALGQDYVVKVDGLAGGKGVKVSGEHLFSHAETIAFCQNLIKQNKPFMIEEKFIGQEFSLMGFCDGKGIHFMPVVADHKRAYVNDYGPNTGGMGSYSDANHSLPFLSNVDLEKARSISRAVWMALQKKCGSPYRGILYGSYIATRDGVGVIEFNARFGDPEVMNVLSILRSDFSLLCAAIASGTLAADMIDFAPLATVCKYLVPNGYPDDGVYGGEVDLSGLLSSDQVYLGSVYTKEGRLLTGGSRTAAVVGVGHSISEAEQVTESGVGRIKGPLFHRDDIGTDGHIQSRVECMQKLRAEGI